MAGHAVRGAVAIREDPLGALCTSNLTNLYGQGVFGVAIGIVGVMATSPSASALGWLAVTGLLLVAFLSHFSTVSIGVPLVGLVAVLILAGAQGPARRVGVRLLVSLAVAVALLYVVYYSHFHEVYRTTIDRVAAREGEAETRSMVAPVSVKAERWRVEAVGTFGTLGPRLSSARSGVAPRAPPARRTHAGALRVGPRMDRLLSARGVHRDRDAFEPGGGAAPVGVGDVCAWIACRHIPGWSRRWR